MIDRESRQGEEEERRVLTLTRGIFGDFVSIRERAFTMSSPRQLVREGKYLLSLLLLMLTPALQWEYAIYLYKFILSTTGF